ncbi:MAG: hypothetical protein OES79_01970 [Planctomycetota bacterium]|nr:hypothetical protein [Planctomycetota bacterium]
MAGHTSAPFEITGVDDSDLEGPQTVTISAAATGYTGPFDTVDVLDDEEPDPIQIIDNGADGFLASGGWLPSQAEGYEGRTQKRRMQKRTRQKSKPSKAKNGFQRRQPTFGS